VTPTIHPISRSIANLRRAISDAEWAGQPTAILAARLASLLIMQQRGEQWDVPF
jgi:hypothetical protein